MSKKIKITIVESFIHPHTGDIERKTHVFVVEHNTINDILSEKTSQYNSRTVVVEPVAGE